jgi:hypothetical protein
LSRHAAVSAAGVRRHVPSSSRISSIEAIDSLFMTRAFDQAVDAAGSKASASNRILYALSNTGPPGSGGAVGGRN